MKYLIGLLVIPSLAMATSFNVPISINGATCSQTSATNFTCGGGPTPPPQCPSPPGPGPCPGPPVPGNCPGFDNTIKLTENWASPTRLFAVMGVNDVIVVQVTVGSVSSPNNNLPKIAAAEYQSSPSQRYATFSATACDFSSQSWAGATSIGNTVTVPFAVGTGANFGFYPTVPLNGTYYFNIKNYGTPSCAVSGVCNMYIDLSHPAGM